MKGKTPKYIDKLLHMLIKDELLESVLGDLYELYEEDLEKRGSQRAKMYYLFNAIAFLRYSRFIGQKNSKTQNSMDLLKNYLKISFRDFKRHKIFASINLFGLISGFTALLLILQFVLFETSYDDFLPEKEQIYRVINKRYQEGQLVQHGAITYPTIGPTLMKQYPAVENYTRITVGGRNYLTYDKEMFLIDDYLWADSNFISFFHLEMMAGNSTGLDEPSQLVISETYAKRLLKSGQDVAELLGQQVRINDWDFSCTIEGIFKDIPVNSHLDFDVAISYDTFIKLAGQGADNSWEWSDFYHYIKLAKHVRPADFNVTLSQFGEEYFKDGEVSGAKESFYLQPVEEIHLNNNLEYEYAKTTDGRIINMLLIISIVIICIAWINYINLTTSRALQRAKEVGVRKVMGAHRKQLFFQFMTESFLINSVAVFLSIGLVSLVNPYIADFFGLHLGWEVFWTSQILNIPVLFYFLLSFFLAVLLIGIYPSIILSGFKGENVIRGNYSPGTDPVVLRKFLVVSQFVLALILISASVTIHRQINFMQNQDLGRDLRRNLVIFGPDMTEFDSAYIDNFEKFKNELTAQSGIVSVTSSSRIFGNKMARAFKIISPVDHERKSHSSNWMAIDHNFIEQFNIELLAGRGFSYLDHSSDGSKINTVILNRSACETFKFENPEAAIGRSIELGDINRTYTIIGVVDNFHQLSLQNKVEPIMLFPFYDNNHMIQLKYEKDKEAHAISKAKELFTSFYPRDYFDYFFLDDYFNRQYRNDIKMSKISAFFTILAIVLALLGLYGLVLITFLKKTKEIGIRKVLGAGKVELLVFFGKKFIQLVLLSAVLGVPLSYYVIQSFLQDYPYKIGPEPWVLVTSVLSLFLLCMAIVFSHVRQVSTNNPVESLRTE